MLTVTKRNLTALGIVGVLTGTAFTAAAAPFKFDPTQIAGPAGPGTDAAFIADEITITGIGSAPITVVDANNNGILDLGDTFDETGLIAAVNFQLNDFNVFGTGIGVNYELLASFDLTGGAFIDASGDVVVDITGGTADVFYDEDLNNAIGTPASQIATLSAAFGDCQITAATGLAQGTCVAIFDFDSSDLGVWQTPGGVELASLETTFRIDINVDQLTPAANPVFPDGPGTSQNILSDFDGSARLEQVPEPVSLALMGIGLIGLAGVTRHRR